VDFAPLVEDVYGKPWFHFKSPSFSWHCNKTLSLSKGASSFPSQADPTTKFRRFSNHAQASPCEIPLAPQGNEMPTFPQVVVLQAIFHSRPIPFLIPTTTKSPSTLHRACLKAAKLTYIPWPIKTL
jgi:hypothetical protein